MRYFGSAIGHQYISDGVERPSPETADESELHQEAPSPSVEALEIDLAAREEEIADEDLDYGYVWSEDEDGDEDEDGGGEDAGYGLMDDDNGDHTDEVDIARMEGYAPL